jgi:hypothetical protein
VTTGSCPQSSRAGHCGLIAHDAGAAELTTLYRFKDPAEGTATLKLRTGDASGLDHYFDRSRVRSGSREAMAEAAYAGWRTDMLNDKITLMTAASAIDVTTLSAQARAERVDAGQVEPEGVPLCDGTKAGYGDWVVTRENNRRLAVHGGRDWVKNGDAWQDSGDRAFQDVITGCAKMKRPKPRSTRSAGLSSRLSLPGSACSSHLWTVPSQCRLISLGQALYRPAHPREIEKTVSASNLAAHPG